jgi:GNAT superfamily N-acetyltransferase
MKINVVELKEEHENDLKVFKASVWPAADQEHYGENKPNFFKEEFTLLAKEEEIVGYITVIADSGVAQIEPLMVAFDRKGEGIGTALLQAAEEKVKSFGCHKLWLETGTNWKAKEFYLKNGFTIRTILPNHIGNQDFVLMDKMI